MARKSSNYFQYLPVSKCNMDWDLYLTGAGVDSIAPEEPYPPSGHPDIYDFTWEKGRVLPEYQVIYISEGEGEFESLEMGRVSVRAGQAILLFPDHWHRYRPKRGVGWKDHWISWNGEYLYKLTRRKQMTPDSAIIDVEDVQEILTLYSRILDTIQGSPGENSHVLAALGMQILALLLDSDSKTSFRPEPHERRGERIPEDEVVLKALEIIWSHSHRVYSVDNLVAHFPVTRRSLERRFGQILGTTIGEEITHSRLARAKHLLKHTNLPIEHVALAVGFSSAAVLGKTFRRLEKSTPSLYRKRR